MSFMGNKHAGYPNSCYLSDDSFTCNSDLLSLMYIIKADICLVDVSKRKSPTSCPLKTGLIHCFNNQPTNQPDDQPMLFSNLEEKKELVCDVSNMMQLVLPYSNIML
jgi:hypothetical protein